VILLEIEFYSETIDPVISDRGGAGGPIPAVRKPPDRGGNDTNVGMDDGASEAEIWRE